MSMQHYGMDVEGSGGNVSIMERIRSKSPPAFVGLRKAQNLYLTVDSKSIHDINLQDKETKIIASLVPDEIIYDIDDYSRRSFDCCLLAGDVSGFTDLTEKYSQAEGGPSKVTQVLNSYIGTMVQESMSHGGDILKFSGDAFIVLYKKTDNFTMRDAVHEAIDCSLMIQKTYGTYTTDVGVVIRVKLLISAGTLHFSIIGDENNAHYLEVGQPIWDLKAGDGKSGPGDIVVCHSAWKFINFNDYIYTELDDSMYVKVHGIGQNWRLVQRNIAQKVGSSKEKSDMSFDDKMEDYALRPAVNYAAANNLKEKLRKFIIRPVMDALDSDQPLDYLTEVRHVAVVFMNVIISKTLKPKIFLKVSNQVYQSVCRILNEYKGEMNKMNAFDKDLMILTIFGLRGYLVGGEAERALRCAWECKSGIQKIRHVESVSIGVCSGNTYCGVFGHTLRKEYTVMGKVVNKAARLMMAYPDMITCERVTLLLSKIVMDFFKLQEYKKLKGIAQPGPVYEFHPVDIHTSLPEKIGKYPLLGRDEELALYRQMLDRVRKSFRTSKTITNVLVTEGPPLIGQRRLSEEFILTTKKDIPINRVCLNQNAKDDPYLPIRLLFYPALGLTEDSSTEEIENQLRSRLSKLEKPNILWVLNEVFKVNFPEENVDFTNESKTQLLRKILKHLTYASFFTLWVILLRKLNFVQPHVWKLISYISKCNVFFLACERYVNCKIPHLYEKNVKIITLKPIPKVFHASLVCQSLQVRGISPELERYIQKKTVGTPGYLENFLTTMLQSNEIIIKSMSRKDAYNNGLVLPSEYIFNRNLARSFTDYDDMRWNMYNECYKESLENILEDEKLMKDQYYDAIIKVALMNASVTSLQSDIYSEWQYALKDKMMLTFDSFTPYEQLIVKASSTLHLQFQRQKLLYVMNTKPDLQAAKAIKSLFEKKVLACAHGDFLEGNEMIFKGRLQKPDNSEIRCDCRGVLLDDFGVFLPKYASCGYMQFRLDEFRDMCYSLLTDKHKKEFHHRAIRYLQHETKKCRACGSGYFAIGLSRQERLHQKTKKDKKGDKRQSIMASYNFLEDEDLGNLNQRRTTHNTDSQIRKKMNYSLDTLSISTVKSGLAKFGSSRSVFKVFKKIKEDELSINSFSDFDFTDCKCLIILTSMYCEIIHHCKGIENPEKLFQAMIDYVYLCMETNNVIEIVCVLNEALEVLNNPAFNEEYQDWMIDLKRGKVYMLFGREKMISNQLDEAYEYFMKAMKFYGFPFPRRSADISRKIRSEKIKHWFRLYISPNHKFTANDDESEFCNDLSECLQYLCSLFMFRNQNTHALLAATWGLNKALDGQENLISMCNAYSQMLTISHCVKNQAFIQCHEVNALKLTRLTRNFEKRELVAIADMLHSVFLSRFIQSKLQKVLDMGRIIWHIGKSTNSVTTLLKCLPLLLHVVIALMLISDSIPILNDIYIFAADDVDNSGFFDYYSLNLILQLETGFSIESLKSCEKFLQKQTFNKTIRDPSSRKRFCVLLWLWYLRKKYWEAAQNWQEDAFNFILAVNEVSIHNILAGCYLLEGCILYLVHKMDKRNVREIRNICRLINELIKVLQMISKQKKLIYIRVEHLTLYYKLVLTNNYKVLDSLKKLKQLAIERGNDLEVTRIEHSELAWMNKLSPSKESRWIDKCDMNKLLDISDMEPGNAGIFTLPLPSYL